MKTMQSAAERVRGKSPFFFIKIKEPKIRLIGTCRFCSSVTYLGVCTRCGAAVVCSGCKRIKVDADHWSPQIVGNDLKSISHGICPDCFVKLHPDIAERMNNRHPHAFEIDEFKVFKVTLHRTKRERIEAWRQEKAKAQTATGVFRSAVE